MEVCGESSGEAVAPRPAFIPEWWAEAAKSVADSGGCAAFAPPVVVVCGPKNSGKSTFSRFLLNTLLPRYGKVGYLDTDVGQSDFFLPGCLSLHIVSEFIADLMCPRLKQPERCFFYGDISSKRDPEAYLNYIRKLYDYFIEEHYKSSGKSSLPLIVNTPGWVKGTGFDTLVEMLRYIGPTHVVQIRISVDSKNLPTGAFWLDELDHHVELIDMSSAHMDSFNRSVLTLKDSHALRDRRLIDYFKQCFPELNIETNKKLAYALASLPPYQVPFSRIKVKHLHCQVARSEVFHSLNATIVGLAVNSGVSPTSMSRHCVGLGIVRGIDVKKDLLYVITPVPLCTLQKVDLILQGFIQIPTSFLQVRQYVSPYMALNVLNKLLEKDEQEI